MLSKEQLLTIKSKNPKNFTQHIKHWYKDEYFEILNFTRHLGITSFSQALFHYINELLEFPKCKTCGKSIEKFLNQGKWEYKKFCSQKCAANNDDLKKRKAESHKKLNRSFKTQQINKKNKILNDESLEILDKNDLKKILKQILKTSLDYQNIERVLINQYPNVLKSIMFHFKNVEIRKACFWLLNDITSDMECKFCGKSLSFNVGLSYSQFCSISCATKFKNVIKRHDKFDKIKKKFEDDGFNVLNNIDEFSNRIDGRIDVVCPKGHTWSPLLSNWYKGVDCDFCSNIGTSKMEKEIITFLKDSGFAFIENSRQIIKPFELDVFIPSHNIAIEFNGLYYHQDNGSNRKYHLDKTELCESKNIQLLHIFENEWLYKKEIVKSIILSKLGKYNQRIFARKCEIREVNNKEKSTFLNENHIQGNDSSKIKIGLYYVDELVSLMTFGQRKITGGQSNFELIRFCNKLNTHVIGGASKLFKFFIKNYEFSKIISYADRRFSNGNLYKILGFIFDHYSAPNYWYFKSDRILYHRSNFQKHLLKNKLDVFEDKLTEWENMKNNNWNRIWDCGNFVFNFYK